MLLKLTKYLKGYVRVKVEGYSPERLLNLCNVHKILLWDVENKGAGYEMYLSVNDYKKIRPLVRKTRTKIILLEKHGLPFFLFKFRKRKVFFCGMFLSVLCIYVLSLFLWNIQIEGNVTQSTEQLLKYMETFGVSHGTLKSKIICEEIETKLRSKYPNVLWVSAEMKGTRIKILIKENTDSDIVSKIEEKNDEAVRIISENQGIVESMIVRCGTPLVKIGDEVAVGQTLVEGFYEIRNDAGEIVRYEGVSADADIFIKVLEPYNDRFSMMYEKKNYTERKRLIVTIGLGNSKYRVPIKIPFDKYEQITKKHVFRITENFYLPFFIEKTWFLEYESEAINYTQDEINHLAEERFYEKYENILQKGVQIIEKDVRIDTNGKLCLVTGNVKMLAPVTKKVSAEIPKLVNEAFLEGEN